MPQSDLAKFNRELNKLADPIKAQVHQRFFKTGKGEYGEGDKFLGIIVPKQRKVARKFIGLSFSDLKKLLGSKIHEHRFIALEILVMKYEKTSREDKQKVVEFYLNNSNGINNWDLVDTSAPYILGNYLLDKSRAVLYKLAHSENLWDRRIAMISTLEFIKNNQFVDTMKIARILLNDKHDLIHKAVGWMLREMGKKDEQLLIRFLNKHFKKMPRTALRYAIERLGKKQKKIYMAK